MVDKKFRVDLIVSYGSQAGIFLFGFVFMFLVTKFAGLAVLGSYALLRSLNVFLNALFSFRTSDALTAYFNKGELTNEPRQQKAALIFSLLLDLMMGVVLYALFTLFADYIAANYLKDPSLSTHVQLFGLYAFLSAVQTTSFGYLQARQSNNLLNSFRFLEFSLRAGLLLLALLQWPPLTLGDILWVTIVACLLTTSVAYIPFIHVMTRTLRGVPAMREAAWLKSFFSFTGITFVSATFKAVNQTADTILIGLLTGPTTAGLYSTLKQFVQPTTFLSAPLPNIVYPRFVRLVLQNNLGEVSKIIRDTNRRILPLNAAIGLTLLPAFWIYQHFAGLSATPAAYVVLAILGVQSVLHSTTWWGRSLANATHPVRAVVANFGAAVILVGVGVPLTSLAGMIGTACSLLVMSVAMLLYWRRMMPVKLMTAP